VVISSADFKRFLQIWGGEAEALEMADTNLGKTAELP